MKDRFCQPGLDEYCSMERILNDLKNGKGISWNDSLEALFSSQKITFEDLKKETELFRHLMETKFPKKQQFSSEDVIEIFNTLTAETKSTLQNFILYLKTLLVVPATSASVERSFSTMKRVQIYLRSTMSEKHLNHCCILHAYHSEVDELDVAKIAAIFVERNE